MTVSLPDLARILGIEPPDDDGHAGASFAVRCIKQGDTLYREGDRFDTVYAIRSGFFKSVSVDASGDETVLAFPMGGDVVGLDAIDSGKYDTTVVAQDAGTVVVVPFARLAALSRQHCWIERLLFTLFSRELVRTREMTRLLATLTAEERLATLLLDLSDRFGRLGFSRASFALRMTRQEIGSYLGIKLETVSRALSSMVAAGLIDVDLRTIGLRDVARLRGLLGPQAHESKSRLRPVRAVVSAHTRPPHTRVPVAPLSVAQFA